MGFSCLTLLVVSLDASALLLFPVLWEFHWQGVGSSRSLFDLVHATLGMTHRLDHVMDGSGNTDAQRSASALHTTDLPCHHSSHS